jgi:hypothetical protein
MSLPSKGDGSQVIAELSRCQGVRPLYSDIFGDWWERPPSDGRSPSQQQPPYFGPKT